jgi:hypothetical protein
MKHAHLLITKFVGLNVQQIKRADLMPGKTKVKLDDLSNKNKKNIFYIDRLTKFIYKYFLNFILYNFGFNHKKYLVNEKIYVPIFSAYEQMIFIYHGIKVDLLLLILLFF